MNNFDESKVKRDHGKFAPNSTSETTLEDDREDIDMKPIGDRVPAGGTLHVEFDEFDDTGNFVGGADIIDKGDHYVVQTEHDATIGPFGDVEVRREDVQAFWAENSDGRPVKVNGGDGTYSARVPVSTRLSREQGTGEIRGALEGEGFVGFDDDADDQFADWMSRNDRW